MQSSSPTPPSVAAESSQARPREVLVVTHSRVASGSSLVRETIAELRRRGFAVNVIDNLEAKPFGAPTVSVDENTEVVVVLGGDGTILRAAELVKATPVPIMGINLGHVGFLAEFESFQIPDAIRRIAEHDYDIEERSIADVKVWLPGADEPIREWALNDVTVEKADRGKMIEIGVKVDDVEMSSYGCDGVLVSTSTGSTAYAFSAGGPIMWPNVQALQLVPLAAHALFSRPIIVGADSRFTIDILNGSSSEGWISCDGRRSRELPRGTSVVVSRCHDTLRLARLSDAPFTQRLVTKFDLPVVGWREHNRSLSAGGGGNLRHAASYSDADEKYKGSVSGRDSAGAAAAQTVASAGDGNAIGADAAAVNGATAVTGASAAPATATPAVTATAAVSGAPVAIGAAAMTAPAPVTGAPATPAAAGTTAPATAAAATGVSAPNGTTAAPAADTNANGGAHA